MVLADASLCYRTCFCVPSALILPKKTQSWCRLRETQGGVCSRATATAFACPSCLTLDLARSCADYVTSVVHSTDLVPCFNAASLERLRCEVLASAWFDSFRSDMRSSSVLYRAAERSVRALGASTYWTAAGLYSVTKATGGLFTVCMSQRCALRSLPAVKERWCLARCVQACPDVALHQKPHGVSIALLASMYKWCWPQQSWASCADQGRQAACPTAPRQPYLTMMKSATQARRAYRKQCNAALCQRQPAAHV